MSKTMLVSVLIASIMIPFAASKDKDPQLGLRKVVMRSALFMLTYCVLLRFVYPRLQ